MVYPGMLENWKNIDSYFPVLLFVGKFPIAIFYALHRLGSKQISVKEIAGKFICRMFGK